jgi:hypothetical protein
MEGSFCNVASTNLQKIKGKYSRGHFLYEELHFSTVDPFLSSDGTGFVRDHHFVEQIKPESWQERAVRMLRAHPAGKMPKNCRGKHLYKQTHAASSGLVYFSGIFLPNGYGDGRGFGVHPILSNTPPQKYSSMMESFLFRQKMWGWEGMGGDISGLCRSKPEK